MNKKQKLFLAGLSVTATVISAIVFSVAGTKEEYIADAPGFEEYAQSSQWQEDDFSFFIPQEEEVFSLADIPQYSGQPYVYVNGNVPFFTEEEITVEKFELYSPLDELGRCQSAFANICTDTLPTEPRGDISSVYPTGWEQEKYEGVDQGWLYNRCHLIAYSLAGENANECNLITGTRYLNTEGMWPVEETVLNYVRENPDNHVLYRITPVFEGDNLLASGVLMEAYSVEDNGSGVQFCVYCYNVQPDVTIDYATGESFKEEN